MHPHCITCAYIFQRWYKKSASLKASIYQAYGQTFETFAALGDPAGGETITHLDY